MKQALLEKIQGGEYYNRPYNILKNISEYRHLTDDGLVEYVTYTLSCEDGDKLAVKENYTYTFDAAGDFAKREKVIEWYDEDENVVNSKPMVKTYNDVDKYIAGQKRRSNIVEKMKMFTVGAIAATEGITIDEAQVLGMTFIIGATTEIEIYNGGARQPLLDKVTNATESWFDNETGSGTIRQIVLAKLDY